MQLLLRLLRPILDKQTVKPPIIRLAHRTPDTNIRRDTRHHQIPNAPKPQQQLEIRMRERTSTRLVDHRLAFDGVQFGNDVVAGLAPHEKPTQGPRRADADG